MSHGNITEKVIVKTAALGLMDISNAPVLFSSPPEATRVKETVSLSYKIIIFLSNK